jgi:hypothetical protein
MGLEKRLHNPATVEKSGTVDGDPLIIEGVLKSDLIVDPGIKVGGVDLAQIDIAGASLAAHVVAADPHTGYVLESLADAANDFIVASGADAFVKKTLAQTKVILGIDSYAAGDILLSSLDTERTAIAGAYSKHKSIQVNMGGAFRVKFSLASGVPPDPCYGKIYVSGVAVGTERSNTGAYVEYSEDISGVVAGDTIELWVHGTTTAALVKNFRIYTVANAVTTTITDA